MEITVSPFLYLICKHYTRFHISHGFSSMDQKCFYTIIVALFFKVDPAALDFIYSLLWPHVQFFNYVCKCSICLMLLVSEDTLSSTKTMRCRYSLMYLIINRTILNMRMSSSLAWVAFIAVWDLFVCLFGFLTSSSTTRLYRGRAPRQERLTILRAATHETELGDHDFCLSRSHYTDTDPTCRERCHDKITITHKAMLKSMMLILNVNCRLKNILHLHLTFWPYSCQDYHFGNFNNIPDVIPNLDLFLFTLSWGDVCMYVYICYECIMAQANRDTV